MKQLFTHSIMLLLLGAVLVSTAAEQAEYKWESDSSDRVSKPIWVDRLRCEYRDQPLGIDHPAPRLSWTLESSVRGQKQTAYRVLVAPSIQALQAGRGDLWDSGKVGSNQSVNVMYAGDVLVSGQCCFWKVKVWDKDGASSDWSAPSSWEMGLLKASDWKGHWISDGKPLPERDADLYRDDAAPLFRREFKLSGPVRSARLYMSALGYVRATLNGRDVGDHHLDPLWTLPNKRVFYSVYDVSKNLEQHDNCLGVTLGNGWYNPLPLRMWGRVNLRERLPVGRPRFIAQLLIEYADGSGESLASDSSWKVAPGPILRNSIYLGEKVDARKDIKNWDKPGLDDRAWDFARIAPAPEGFLQVQPLPPIKVTASVKPVRITEPSDGVYIVDMGQNFAGWARFTFNVPEGTEITMRYGELLYENGTLNPMTSVCGQIKRENPGEDGSPAVAWQADTYIARGGGPEIYTPRFTFHAFRYVEITGLPARPSLDAVEGLRMNSAVEPVGSFSCSNDRFNRIQTMCQWTFLSNLFGVQSDCPHRERFGYGGDLVTTSDAFMLNYDMANFYAKAVRDWHDSALPDGMLTDTAPSVGIQYCGVGWAMAHPHLQVQLYRYYADRRIIEEQYATSKRWLELVRGENKDHIVRRGLHDHEALEKEESPPMITPLYCESVRTLSLLARILGKEKEADEYDRLAENIRKAYIENFLAPGTGVVASGIQSVQAFALFLNMLPAEERPAALAHLVEDITDKHSGHLTTGIFGTRYMLDVLSRERRAEVVNDMVNLRGFPGWGNMLEQGATTLWEHWQFSDNTFSHNHPMFGSVSQWFYNWLGGIEPAVDAVGFDKFTFQPQFLEGLDWVRCTYRSIRGPITCDWKRQGDRVAIDLHVPVNTSATLILPTVGVITENGRPATDSKGVEKVSERDGRVKLRLGSGRYHFTFAPSELIRNPF
jgi:alpha-L-rhamnosidase